MAKSKQVNVSISEEEYQEWKQIADSQNRTMAGFIRYAVETYILVLKKRLKTTRKGVDS